MATKKWSTGKIRIVIKSFDHVVINQAVISIIESIERSWAIISWPIPMPTKIKKYTVNKATFVCKDARDQYEIRIHKRLIDISEPTTQTINTLKTLALPSWVETEIKMI